MKYKLCIRGHKPIIFEAAEGLTDSQVIAAYNASVPAGKQLNPFYVTVWEDLKQVEIEDLPRFKNSATRLERGGENVYFVVDGQPYYCKTNHNPWGI